MLFGVMANVLLCIALLILIMVTGGDAQTFGSVIVLDNPSTTSKPRFSIEKASDASDLPVELYIYLSQHAYSSTTIYPLEIDSCTNVLELTTVKLTAPDSQLILGGQYHYVKVAPGTGEIVCTFAQIPNSNYLLRFAVRRSPASLTTNRLDMPTDSTIGHFGGTPWGSITGATVRFSWEDSPVVTTDNLPMLTFNYTERCGWREGFMECGKSHTGTTVRLVDTAGILDAASWSCYSTQIYNPKNVVERWNLTLRQPGETGYVPKQITFDTLPQRFTNLNSYLAHVFIQCQGAVHPQIASGSAGVVKTQLQMLPYNEDGALIVESVYTNSVAMSANTPVRSSPDFAQFKIDTKGSTAFCTGAESILLLKSQGAGTTWNIPIFEGESIVIGPSSVMGPMPFVTEWSAVTGLTCTSNANWLTCEVYKGLGCRCTAMTVGGNLTSASEFTLTYQNSAHDLEGGRQAMPYVRSTDTWDSTIQMALMDFVDISSYIFALSNDAPRNVIFTTTLTTTTLECPRGVGSVSESLCQWRDEYIPCDDPRWENECEVDETLCFCANDRPAAVCYSMVDNLTVPSDECTDFTEQPAETSVINVNSETICDNLESLCEWRGEYILCDDSRWENECEVDEKLCYCTNERTPECYSADLDKTLSNHFCTASSSSGAININSEAACSQLDWACVWRDNQYIPCDDPRWGTECQDSTIPTCQQCYNTSPTPKCYSGAIASTLADRYCDSTSYPTPPTQPIKVQLGKQCSNSAFAIPMNNQSIVMMVFVIIIAMMMVADVL